MAQHLLATLRIETDADIVRIRQVASEIAQALGFGTFAKTRAVTALLELARNAIEYAGGGSAQLSVGEENGVLALVAMVNDQGPGIANLGQILAGENVQSNGLGLGLYGVKRIASRFDVISGSEGTRIDVAFGSDHPGASLKEALSSAKKALTQMETLDPAAALSEQNRDLLDAIAARDLLMKEIHHRTGNNLALISALIGMSAREAQSTDAKQVLKDLKARVSAVMAAHQHLQLTDKSDRLSSRGVLTSIVEQTTQAFNGPNLNVRTEYTGDDLLIDGENAINLGLILSELVTNAYKHAFEGRTQGKIVFGLTKERNGTRLSVADDGAGLPYGVEKPERSDSLGWQIVRLLAKQYGATVIVDGTRGFQVAVQFSKDIDARPDD